MSWATQEVSGADFGDKRLNKRGTIVLERLGDKPALSIPAACNGWGETQAAYRFFDNDRVTWDKVLSPHIECTLKRMAQEPVVLCIQDTTELSYGNVDITGLGPLNHEKQRGIHLHPTLAVTPQRVPLGTLDMWMWARDDETFAMEKDKNRPIIEKESVRWLEGYQYVNGISDTLPDTQCVYVADRESDIYELFAENHQLEDGGADLLVRVSHVNRKLTDGNTLINSVEKQPVLGEIEFDLPARDNEPARRVTQTLRTREVELKAPYRSDQTLPNVKLTIVLAREENPPAGCKAVQWLLATTMEVNTFKQAAQKVQWYLCRWQIEIFFKVLKSGCTVEKLQLEHVDRLEPALAIFMIVAWRVLYLTMLGRVCPNLSCEVVFDTEEWQTVYRVTHKGVPPENPPTLDEMVRMVAILGGFLNRKNDGPPGAKTVWIGMQRARDLVWGAQMQRLYDG